MNAKTIDATETRHQLQTMPTDTLAAAARGEIDLNEIARMELRARGLDNNGKWVGFNG